MRRTYHHELRHLIEYNLYGSYAPKDANWESCNASSFRYGNGGSEMYNDAAFAHKIHPQSGFVTGYATSGIEEDKAEIYAAYMTDPQALQNLAATDDLLSCKVSATKQLLQLL